MPIYMSGFISSPLYSQKKDIPLLKRFTEISYPQLTNIEIGWNYLLLWISEKLFINYDFDKTLYDEISLVPLELPEINEYCKFVLHHGDKISILSKKNCIWEYEISSKSWKMIKIHMLKFEDAVKIAHYEYMMILTNLGRVIIPDLPGIYDNGKYIDILCGLEHTILLTEDNNVYSMGTGMRGQLGNGNVSPDSSRVSIPHMILALKEMRIVQISAGAWHNAAITEQGDLYTWGWNKCGELGFNNDDIEIQSTPKLVRFKDDQDNNIEVNVKKVRCGHFFTICLADDGTFWGSGSNCYNQLGKSQNELANSKKFIKLDIGSLDIKKVKDFNCNGWGTVIITE